MRPFGGNVRKLFGLVGVIAKNPNNLRLGLRALNDAFEVEDRRKQVIRKHGFGKGLQTVCILDFLQESGEIVDPYSFLCGMSPPMDIALLRALARQFDECHYMEIGSWRGESLANVASIAKECVSVSLSPEEMRSFGASEKEVRTANFFSKSCGNVKHIGHNSHTFDFTPYHGRFDLVFIDGDHSYDGVLQDTLNAFKLLRDDRSVIVWHDYGKSPEHINWPVFAAMLDACPAESRKHLYQVSNTLCAIYHPGKLKASCEEFADMPKRNFSVAIKGKRTDAQNP